MQRIAALVRRVNPRHLLHRIKSFLKSPVFQKMQAVKALFGSENDTPEQKLKRMLLGKISLAFVALVLTIAMVFAMTAAWHTNVIQSTGLIFNVSEWGMDTSTDIQSEMTNAAPGERGALNVKVYNSSEGIIDVNLSISKVSLYNDLADMRKRLYFYIDDTVTRNEETVGRVYLNSQEQYTYTVLAKQNLLLGAQGNNAALIWEWVYDVLGYYFCGTVTADAAEVTEYLRPIVYDFDSATFKDGKLQTVDGSTTAAEFIKQLSKTDGFAGSVTTSKVTSDGRVYYPVSVDENGSGIWMYCCSLSEIEHENTVDTALGNATDQVKRQFRTSLNVVAEQKKLTVATVNTADDLRAALADDTHNMIVLADNIEINETINVAASGQKIVDLSEHTISTKLTGNMLTMSEGAAVTVMNGTIQGNSSHTGALISAVGSDVALSGLTITDVADAVWIADQNAKKTDTRMNITDCIIRCSDSGVFIKGNGAVTTSRTYLNIENTEIISTGYYGLVGNGSVSSNGNYGTDITVRNSTLKANYCGIYHPQRDSYLLVEDCTVEGMTPFVVKGGTVTIRNGAINATNDAEDADLMDDTPRFEGSGFSNIGAGVYVETGYDYPCSVTIDGTTRITSHHHDAVLLYEADNPRYSVKITGGDYSHDVSAFTAEGYSCTADSNGRYIVSKN